MRERHTYDVMGSDRKKEKLEEVSKEFKGKGLGCRNRELNLVMHPQREVVRFLSTTWSVTTHSNMSNRGTFV